MGALACSAHDIRDVGAHPAGHSSCRLSGVAHDGTAFLANERFLCNRTVMARAVLRGVMGKHTGFMESERGDRCYEKPNTRKKSWTEFVKPLPYAEVANQAARCMDCGIP